MNLFIVENGKLIEYERLGECNGCGDCCESKHTITYEVKTCMASTESDEVDTDYSDFEGWVCLWAQRLWWWWNVFDKEDECQACSSFDKQTRKCKIWKDDIEFPAICRYWPVHPKNIERFPRCGFSFKRIEETL